MLRINFNNLQASKVTRPNYINNEALVTKEEEGVLRSDVVLGTDFVVLPSMVWNVLHEWYSGGPEIVRTVVAASRCEL